MSQINVAFGIPAYPTSSTTSTTSTTTTTTPSPIAGNWRDFLNRPQQPARSFNGNIGRSLTPFGSRFRGSQPQGTFGNNGVGRNVMSSAAARNIVQTVLGRNGAEQALSGIPASLPSGDLNSIMANTAQRFTQPNGMRNTNRPATNQLRPGAGQQIISSQFTSPQLSNDVNRQFPTNQLSNSIIQMGNQFTTSQVPNDWFQSRVTNFQIQDPPSSISDQSDAIGNFVNQMTSQQTRADGGSAGANFPLLNRIVQQSGNPQLMADRPSVTFQMNNEPASQVTSLLQVSPQIFEGTPSNVDISQLPHVEQIFPATRQPRRNFVSITSNVPFSSSMSQNNAGTLTIVPSLQQIIDTGSSIPFLSQTSPTETFITTESGFPVSDGAVTIQTVPESVWISSAAASNTQQRSSTAQTNTVDWAMLDELMQQQSRQQQQRVSETITSSRGPDPGANAANDGFSLNQVDLSQFTANLDGLGGTQLGTGIGQGGLGTTQLGTGIGQGLGTAQLGTGIGTGLDGAGTSGLLRTQL